MNQELATQQPEVLALVERALKDKDFDVQKLHSLLDFQERVMDKQAEQLFFRDFAEALKEMPHVAKNGTISMGGKGSIAFAKYEDIDNAIRPVENAHGFSRSFLMDGTNMILLLAHKNGHSIRSVRPVTPDAGPGRNATQAMGSGESYAKRYLTNNLWNIITDGEDDNGKMAGAITEEQCSKLEELAKRVPNFNAERCFKTYGIKNFSELQRAKFQEVKTLLEEGVRRRT